MNNLSTKPYIRSFTRQDLIKDPLPDPVRYAAYHLNMDIKSIAELFKALSQGTLPVLIHPFWDDQTKNNILEDLPAWKLPEEPCIVVFTSGSSGKPKGCLLPVARLIKNAYLANTNIPLGETDEWLLNLPLFHVGGLGILFRTWVSGARLSFSETTATTHQSIVPTQLYRMLKNIPKRKVLLIGGGAISGTALDVCLDKNAPIYRTYGMTETCSQISTTRPHASREELLCSGYPLSEINIKMIDQRIYVQTPSLMLRYTNSDHGYKQDEWFQTSDLGEMTVHGLRVLGRSDRAFKSGGEIIQPESIEQALLKIPSVMQAHVASKEDAEYGSRIVAYIETTKDLDFVKEHAYATLKGLFRPHEFFDWDQRPKGTKDRL